MNEHHGQAHYAPASVGALIDTSFLRSAAMDANDERRDTRTLASPMRLRLIGAVRALVTALRRH